MANPTIVELEEYLFNTYPSYVRWAVNYLAGDRQGARVNDRQLLTHEVLFIICYNFFKGCWKPAFRSQDMDENFKGAALDFCTELAVDLNEHCQNYNKGSETPAIIDGRLLIVNARYLTFSRANKWFDLHARDASNVVIDGPLPVNVKFIYQLFLPAEYMEVYSKHEAQHSNQEPVSQS